ncbi:SOUL heme-binding protein [Rosistilla carotiformis]|uniref:SOUL heme-binding protein n=1 Tax=Rosistilla carotiformis TaxID=2528017 RepID=A0A518JUR7_9BACT|nr:heme-binding protein [Rosistilla carotiformis]QDV69284.1 SOUL heme-binding protein [Rosistilla carotiformis]
MRKVSGIGLAVLLAALFLAGKGRADYETAAYDVVEKEGEFEIRDYPELVLASTAMGASGGNGSFMRLFGYISGSNQAKQKVSMTTPVFMQPSVEQDAGMMSFVVPKQVAEDGTPAPSRQDVNITKRPAGRFAVIRFAGRMNDTMREEAEQKLRGWIEAKGLKAGDSMEYASYDPPFTPAPLRRNEVFLRLQSDKVATETVQEPSP